MESIFLTEQKTRTRGEPHGSMSVLLTVHAYTVQRFHRLAGREWDCLNMHVKSWLDVSGAYTAVGILCKTAICVSIQYLF